MHDRRDITEHEQPTAWTRPPISIWKELQPKPPERNGWPVWTYRVILALRAHRPRHRHAG